MTSYVHRHCVTLDETNVVGNVYFAHFVRWQGHCREHFLAEHAPGVLAELRSGQLRLVTVSCAMDFYAECFAFDSIDIAMTLRSTTGHRLTMDFEFLRRDKLVACGRQTVACLGRSGSGTVPVPLPEELSKALHAFGQPEVRR